MATEFHVGVFPDKFCGLSSFRTDATLMLDSPFEPWPSYSQSEIEAVTKVLATGRVNYWTGKLGKTFETRFAEFVGVQHAVALANGTVALDLIWQALKQPSLVLAGKRALMPGDEIIVTPRTFLASVSSIVNAGLIPVFADVDADTQNITVDTVSQVLSERTRGILAVHLAGWPCDMPGLAELAEAQGLWLIEDAAQAHGATVANRQVGSLGHAAAFSFCQDKIMTTAGEGGMVTTNDQGLYEYMWSYKDHGKDYTAMHTPAKTKSTFRWVHHQFGTNWRMLEMQAASGLYQLEQLPSWVAARRANAQQIWAYASSLPGLRVAEVPAEVGHACYKAYVFVEPEQLSAGWHRDRILAAMVEYGVPAFYGSCAEVYLEKAFDNTTFRPHKRLPVAQALGETSLMFMVHPTLSQASIQKTCETLGKVMGQACR